MDKEVKSHNVYSLTIWTTSWRLPHVKQTSNFRMAGVSNSILISHIFEQIDNSRKVADWMVHRWSDGCFMLMISHCSVKVYEVKTIMNILNGTCSRFGLTNSFPKTKTQVFNNDELANLPSLFSSGDNMVENVSESIYLGQTFRNKTQGFFQWRIRGEGSGGPGPPLTFRPNWGLGRTKKFF